MDHMHNKIIKKTIHKTYRQIIIMFHSKIEPVQKLHKVYVIQAMLQTGLAFSKISNLRSSIRDPFLYKISYPKTKL